MKITCTLCGAQLISTGKGFLGLRDQIMVILRCPNCGKTEKVCNTSELTGINSGELAEYKRGTA